MITPSNVSNPIGAVRPNFGMYTLGKDNSILTRMFSNIATRAVDNVQRETITQNPNDVGKELAMENWQ